MTGNSPGALQLPVPEEDYSRHARAGMRTDDRTEQHLCNIGLRIYGFYQPFQFVCVFGAVPVNNINPISAFIAGGGIFFGQSL